MKRVSALMRWVGPVAIVGATFAMISDQLGLVGCASSSTTQSGVSEDDSHRNSAVEIRPGKGSATQEGACDENVIV